MQIEITERHRFWFKFTDEELRDLEGTLEKHQDLIGKTMLEMVKFGLSEVNFVHKGEK
jgi:hypothetical protein